jgi:hypothetical protein
MNIRPRFGIPASQIANVMSPERALMWFSGWISLLNEAGFELADVLLRDADEVIIASMKSQ